VKVFSSASDNEAIRMTTEMTVKQGGAPVGPQAPLLITAPPVTYKLIRLRSSTPLTCALQNYQWRLDFMSKEPLVAVTTTHEYCC